MDVLALIPARGGSKSIPGKNIAPLAGKPLLAYSIEVALASRLITRVLLSTDSEQIRQVGLYWGAEAPFLRPAELAQDETPDWPVFKHALQWLIDNEGYRPEAVVQLRPTSPLRRVEHVDGAIQALLDDPEADSVRAVAPPCLTPFKMWRIEPGSPYMEPLLACDVAEPYNQCRQYLPVVWAQTGYVEVIRPRTILEKGSITGQRIRPYPMPNYRMLDIDEPSDLEWAEFLLSHGRY